VAISDLQRNPAYETVTSLTLVVQASDWRAQPPMDGFAFRRCSHQIEVGFLKENLMVDLSSKGWRVESVELDPDEFKRDCDLTQSPKDRLWQSTH
jgi:hypothetical protein